MAPEPSETRSEIPRIDLESPYEDERGTIQPLVDEALGSAAIVFSKEGAVRANHFHKTDAHYVYIISGEIEYYHRPTGSNAGPEKEIYRAGQMFFSPPRVDHAMYFPKDTVFIVLSRNPRDHESYESDVVRIPNLIEGKS